MLKSYYFRHPKNLKLYLYSKQKFLLFKSSKAALIYPIYGELNYLKKEKKLVFKEFFKSKKAKAFFHLYQILLNQRALGLLFAYRKQLNLVGIGYQISIEKKKASNYINLKLGFSHVVRLKIPSYIFFSLPKPRILLIKSIDLQKLTNFTSIIRCLRLPSVYKEKGIYSLGETISLKQGKKT